MLNWSLCGSIYSNTQESVSEIPQVGHYEYTICR